MISSKRKLSNLLFQHHPKLVVWARTNFNLVQAIQIQVHQNILLVFMGMAPEDNILWHRHQLRIKIDNSKWVSIMNSSLATTDITNLQVVSNSKIPILPMEVQNMGEMVKILMTSLMKILMETWVLGRIMVAVEGCQTEIFSYLLIELSLLME